MYYYRYAYFNDVRTKKNLRRNDDMHNNRKYDKQRCDVEVLN